ncbi:MAG: hypothetical protein ACYC44_01885, partial [Patescibacteria group bacterium]
MDDSDRAAARGFSMPISRLIKTASLAGLLVLLGAGCVKGQVAPKGPTAKEAIPSVAVTTTSESGEDDVIKGIRDWCGSYDDAKRHFSDIRWDAMDSVVATKSKEGWADLSVCIRNPLLGYTEYGKEYVRSDQRPVSGGMPTSTVVYFKMGQGPAGRDFVSIVPKEHVETAQVMLLGYWDTRS